MKKMRYSAVALAALAMVAASCGSSSKPKADATSSSAAATTKAPDAATTAKAPDTTKAADPTTTKAAVQATQANGAITIAVITHSDGGVFWSVFKKGAEKAGKDLGITVKEQGSNNNGVKQAEMINQAVTDKVAGIAVSLADKAAVKDAVAAAVKAGIPVVTTNSGSDSYKEFGAFTHIGQDEFQAGAGAGERFQAAGVKTVLCAKQEQTNSGLDARCAGMKSTFKGKYLEVTTSGDKSGKQQADLKAKIDTEKDVDAVFGTGPVVAHDAAAAAKELGRKVMVGGVDLSTDILKDIASGEVSFTIDQQQYLQGYVSVLALYLKVTNQNTLGGGLPIATGPGFVTKENAAAVADLVGKGTR
jgi:simple sugar transport system substrate-binding protein